MEKKEKEGVGVGEKIRRKLVFASAASELSLLSSLSCIRIPHGWDLLSCLFAENVCALFLQPNNRLNTLLQNHSDMSYYYYCY